MKVGLLWYDGDTKKESQTKVDQAVERYREKFGVSPNTCHVNPDDQFAHDAIRIVPNRWIRPNYYWIGVDEETLDIEERRFGTVVPSTGGGPVARSRGYKAG